MKPTAGNSNALLEYFANGQISRIAHTHRPAHKHQPGKILRTARHSLARVDTNQLPRNRFRVEKSREIARAFAGRVAEDSDGFHGCKMKKRKRILGGFGSCRHACIRLIKRSFHQVCTFTRICGGKHNKSII